MHLIKALAILAAISILPLAARECQPNLLSFGAGVFDIDKHHPRPMFQIEYKSNREFFKIRPLMGFMATGNGSVYLYAGIFGDIFLGKGFVVTPSFAPGVYFKGSGKDLGYPIEFRSCMEVSYEFKNRARFGAQFYHLSNASLGHRNPGTEDLVFFFAIPLKK